jgi:hypothetical protein
MSEILRKPERLRLQGICKIPAGKAGKAAAKQYANERKARIRALSQLAAADYMDGVGLLVMLNSADRGLGRYIFKKLDKVIPFYVRALSDGTSGMPAEEMSWLMDACERRGYRTLWLDLTGTEKIDKKAVLHLVVGELIRVLEEPAPERALAEALGETLAEAEVEPEAEVVEESTEPEMAETALEMAEVEAETEATVEEELGAPDEEIASETTDADESTMPDEEAGIETEGAEESTNNLEESIERADVEIIQEEPCEKAETVQEEPSLSAEKEAGDMVEAYAVQAEPETEEKTETVNEAAESPVVVEEILTTEEKPAVTEEPATEESATEEAPAVEAKPAEEEKSAAEEKTVTEEKPAAKEEPVPEEKPVPRRRPRKTPAKPEGEKAPAKPRRKREPAAPLTVEATLAKRRRQMGLE